MLEGVGGYRDGLPHHKNFFYEADGVGKRVVFFYACMLATQNTNNH